MAFQIKDFTSIAAGMLNRMRSTTTKITDYNTGSVARTLVEAPAIEIDEMYQQIFNGLKEAIPVATYNSFDFSLLPAVPASGNIRVTITSNDDDVLISAGTVFTPDGGGPFTYVSSGDVTVASGETTGDVLVAANVGGVATNLPANTQFTANPSPEGFLSATNIASFTIGSDEETEDQRKIRFQQFIQALPRGTVAALEYGAKTSTLYDANGVEIERVRSVKIVEPWLDDPDEPISLVNLYIHNGTGSTSGDLIAHTNNVIYGYYDDNGVAVPGWKAAGVKVVVAAATEQVQNVSGVLTAMPMFGHDDLADLAEAAIAEYMLGLDIGEPFQCATAISLVMAIEGVANFIMGTPDPSADVPATTPHHKIMPGTLTIT